MIGTLTRVGALRRFVQCALWCTFGALVCLGGRPAFAATYTWNVTSGLWTDNLSWAPTTSASGTGPVAADSVVFTGSTNQTVDLNGGSRTVANWSYLSGSTTLPLTVTATNGSLTINGGDQAFGVAANGMLTTDLSGLSAFTYSQSSAGRTFSVRPTTSTSSGTTVLNLAMQGTGTNSITAGVIAIGGAAGTSQGTAWQGILGLGKANALSGTSMNVGGFNGSGSVAFQAGVSNGTLIVRGTGGGANRVTVMTVGETSSGSRDGSGTVDLTGGTIDALVTTLKIGRQHAGGNIGVSGALIMPGGTLDATTIILGEKSDTTGTPTISSTFSQLGGLLTSSTIVFGNSLNATNAATPTFNSIFNLSSGILRASVITTVPTVALTNGTSNSASVRRIAWSGGTISNYDASTDLTISGTSTNAGYTMQLVLGSTTTPQVFSADSGRTITIGANAVISGTGLLQKQGDGTLRINTAATFTGSTGINGGTVQLGVANGLPTATALSMNPSSGTATLDLNGFSQTLASLASSGVGASIVDVAATGTSTLTVGGDNANATFAGTLRNSGGATSVLGFTKNGTGTWTLTGSNSALAGNLVFNAGKVTIDPGAAGSFTSTGRFQLLPGAGVTTTVEISSGSNSFSTAAGIGGLADNAATGTAVWNIVGGTTTLSLTTNRFLIGNKGTGNVNVSNGALTFNGTTDIVVGGDASFAANDATGAITVSGGTVSITGAGNLVLGRNVTGTTTGANGTINLDGGVFATARPFTTGASGTVNFNGGTLRALASSTNFIAVTTANIKDGGAIIDTNSFNVAVAQPLLNTGTGGLTKINSGTLTLTATNTFTQGLTMGANAGTVVANVFVGTGTSALGSGTASVGAGSLLLLNNTSTTNTGVTVNNPITGSGTVQLNFAAGTTAARSTFMTGLSGFTGSLVLSATGGATSDKLNAGTGGLGTLGAALVVQPSTTFLVTNSSTSTFTNGITVSGTGNSEGFGAIRFGRDATLGGPVSLAADATIGSGGTNAVLSGNVTTTATSTLTFGTPSATAGATFSGNMGDGTGRLALTKTQSGTLTLTGANTYTGTTSIQGGVVSVGSGGASGSIAGDVAVSSGASLVFNRTGAFTYAGNVSGAGALTVLGGGTVTLGGTNSYGGGTTVSAGRLVGTTSSLQGAITNNATVEFAQAASGTYSAAMGGSGALVQTGPGTLTLAAVNSYGGNTTVGGGTLAIGTSQALSGGLVLGAASGATAVGAVDLTTASGTFGSLTVQTFTSNTNVITIGSGQTLATNGNVTIGATPTTSGTFATNLVVTGATAGVGGWSITNSQAAGSFVAGVNTGGSGTANSVTVDLSSLGTFTANLSGASSVFRVGNPSGNNAAGAAASLTLAVSSTVTAKTIGVGSASGESKTFSLYLGSGAQRLNTDSLIVGNGSSRAAGQLLFAGPTGSLVLRGTNGIGRTDVTMVSGNATTGSLPTATIDVRGHDADLLIGTLAMTTLTGNAGNAYASTFSFDQGTLDVTTLTMGSKSSTAAGTNTNTATVELGSSTNSAVNTSTIGSISMASHSGTSSTIRAVLTIAGANTTVTATGSWLVASNFAASGAGVSSGTVNVSGGTVNANQGIVLRSGSGFGTVDGTLNLTGGVLTSGGDITSAGTFGGGSATLTLNGGRLDMGGFAIGGAGQTVTANFQSGTLSNLGEFNNGAVLTKSSASTLTLSGSSGYTGGTTVSGSGKLVAAGANALGTGTVTLQSARADTTTTFELSGGIAVTNPLVIDVTTGRNNLGGTGAAVNTIAGPITVSGNSSNVTIFQPTTAGGSLNVTGAITAASYTSALSFRGVGSTSGTLAGAVTAAGADVAVDSSGRWTVTSTGNTWAVTRIYSSGTWVVGANDALATGARLAFGSTTTGGVDLNGFNQAVAGLDSTFAGIGTVTNSSASANSVLTLAGLAANSTYRGIVADGPTRNVGLVMNSAGRTQTLSGANTYTGSTIITAGTLALGAGGSISSSPLIKVAGGATYDVSAVAGYALAGGQTLGGVGTVLGDVTVAGGATLSPGNSPGTLLQTGNQTWGGGGNYNWQLYDSGSTAIAGTGWDFLSVAGALSITASGSNPFNVNLWTLSGINPDVNGFANNFDGSADYAWDFATFSGGISGFNPTAFSIVTSATNGTGGFLNNDATGAFSVRLKPGDSNTLQIVYAAVPEPGGIALAGIGTGLAAWLVRRRRARKAG